jgi:hypothetical protein
LPPKSLSVQKRSAAAHCPPGTGILDAETKLSSPFTISQLPSAVGRRRSTRVESAILVHAPSQRRPLAHARKSRMSAAERCPPGTGFLEAETGPQNHRQRHRTPAETGRRRNGVAEIPAQTAQLNLTGKYPVRKDWVVETKWIETGCPPLSLSNESPVGARNGNFRCRDKATKSAILARIQQQSCEYPANDSTGAPMSTPADESSRQNAKINRERLAAARPAILDEEAKRATAVRENMARLRELRLAKEAQEVGTEISTSSQTNKTKPKRRFS